MSLCWWKLNEALQSMPDLVDFDFRIFDDDDSDLEEDLESADDESKESDNDEEISQKMKQTMKSHGLMLS